MSLHRLPALALIQRAVYRSRLEPLRNVRPHRASLKMENASGNKKVESTSAEGASTVLGFEKNGATKNASEETWRNLLKSWRRDASLSSRMEGGTRKPILLRRAVLTRTECLPYM